MQAHPLRQTLGALAVAALAAAPHAAGADVITISFSGTVGQYQDLTGAPNIFGAVSPQGQSITGTVVFDTTVGLPAMPQDSSDGVSSFYNTSNGAISFSATIDGQNVSFSSEEFETSEVNLYDYSISSPPRTQTQLGVFNRGYDNTGNPNSNFTIGEIELYTDGPRLFSNFNDLNSIASNPDVDVTAGLDAGEGSELGYFDTALGNYDYLLFFTITSASIENSGAAASPVPEPGTLVLLSMGLIGFGVLHRRRPMGSAP